MLYNPFLKLGIQATKNKSAISEAYNRLITYPMSENELFDINAAYEDCLMYAGADGEMDLFSAFNNN